MTTPPTTTFSGVLKQIPTVDLTAEERQLIDACFPNFRADADKAQVLFDLGVGVHMTAHQQQLSGWGRMKRYAGSADLSPGRYYSVCSDDVGYDRATLMNELMTYWDHTTMIWPTITDKTLVPVPASPGSEPEPEPCLVLRATRYAVREQPFRQRTIEADAEITARLPLLVREVEIPAVVDLRIPDTQRWFFEHFVQLEERAGREGVKSPGGIKIKTYKFRRIRDFVELLPTLVVPGVGGSLFHQGIGAWLRCHGVNGLVFPSARCDAYLRVLEHRVHEGHRELSLEFSGWNFVDYRGAGPCDWEPLFGWASNWARSDKIGISVMRLGGDELGWEIRGAEEAERRRVRLSRDVMTGRLSPVDLTDPRSAFRRPYYERAES